MGLLGLLVVGVGHVVVVVVVVVVDRTAMDDEMRACELGECT